jgi:hypothetical protein
MLFDAADDGHDRMPSVDDDWPTDVDALSSSLDDPSSFPNPFHDFTFDPIFFLRLILFLPWCIAVGGTILFSPSSTHLSQIAFHPLYHPSAPTGIQRFAYYAHTAVPHVGIFCACVVWAGWWWSRVAGSVVGSVLIGAGMLAGVVWAWSGFVVDKGVPLGADDRQAVYLAVFGLGFDERDGAEGVQLKKGEEGYFVIDRLDE